MFTVISRAPINFHRSGKKSEKKSINIAQHRSIKVGFLRDRALSAMFDLLFFALKLIASSACVHFKLGLGSLESCARATRAGKKDLERRRNAFV